MFSPILIPIVQFVSFVIAAFSAILNITKNEHQWTDVIIGSIVGNLIALLVVSSKGWDLLYIRGREGVTPESNWRQLCNRKMLQLIIYNFLALKFEFSLMFFYTWSIIRTECYWVGR
jgi:hypothetical protein